MWAILGTLFFSCCTVVIMISLYLLMHVFHLVFSERTAINLSLRCLQFSWRCLFMCMPWVRLRNFPTTQQWDSMVGTGPCLIMVNHTSQLDGFLFAMIAPTSILLRTRSLLNKRLFNIPVFGPIFRMIGHLPVHFLKDEEGKFSVDKEKQAKVTEKVQHHLKVDRGNLAFCPEGTINRGDVTKLCDFRHGTFSLAIENRLPIYGICNLGNHHFWPNSATLGGRPATIDNDMFAVQEWNDMLEKGGPLPDGFNAQTLSAMAQKCMQASVDKIIARGLAKIKQD